MDEVLARYNRAKMTLEQFRQKNESLLAKLDALQTEVKLSTEEVKETYLLHKTQLGATYGGFTLVKTRKVDANALVEAFPDAILMVKYAMSVKELEYYVSQGGIPDQVADECTSIKESIRGPGDAA